MKMFSLFTGLVLGSSIAYAQQLNSEKTYKQITQGSMDDSFNFIFHGDWGWNSFNQTLTAYEMSVFAWLIDTQFVIALGDNFSEDGVTDSQDEVFDTIFHDIYSSPALDVPWYVVLGNHGKAMNVS
jgi:acid phosphatase